MLRRSGRRSEDTPQAALRLTDRDRRVAILVQFRLGQSASECLQTLQKALGDEAPSQTMIHKWFARFRCGSVSLDDDDREGRPNSAITDTTVAAVRRLLDEDRRVTIREIEKYVGISDSGSVTILHDHLGMRKVSHAGCSIT